MNTFFNHIMLNSIKLWHVLLTVAIALFLMILFQLIAAPAKTYQEWEAGELTALGNTSTDSLTQLLYYKQALLKASSSDSIYMVLSIPDSMLTIAINGVAIFSTQISHYALSTFLSRINTQQYKNQFATPQKVEMLHASIIKEPIKIKMAPKNAEEAARLATIPDSVTYETAFIHYQLNNGLQIYLAAENEPYLSLKRSVKKSINNLNRLTSAIIHCQIISYNPELSISVDNEDLTAIYRALPKSPYIIIRL